MRITTVGHATLLLDLGGVTLLTDPNFDRALGLPLGQRLRRVAPPGVALAALPRLDAVLVSHAHLDHLSVPSLRAIVAGAAALAPDAPPLAVLAPPAVARWLARIGIAGATALPPDGTATVVDRAGRGAVTVHAARAAHDGSRWKVDRWRAAANMYVVATDADAPDPGACFFAGDTGLRPDTHALAERVARTTGRPVDVALLPIGDPPAWKARAFRDGHLTAADALALFDRLRETAGARALVPYHWGTFNHFTSGADDGVTRLRTLLAANPAREAVYLLAPGETLVAGADAIDAPRRASTAPPRPA